jgi:phenylacetate-CoA ligase
MSSVPLKVKIFDYIGDLITGKYTREAYSELLKTQYYSKPELQNYQENKLKAIVKHAYENVPFYHELYKKNNIHPSDIRKIEDLKKLPIIDKKQLMQTDPPNYFSKLPSKQIRPGMTSGTTGTRMKIGHDVHTRSYAWAAYWRWYNWMGLNHGVRKVRVWGLPRVNVPFRKQISKKIQNFMSNQITLNGHKMNKDIMKEHIEEINRFKPKHIHGYSSALRILADLIDENNMEVPKMVVSTTAEPLSDEDRQVLMDVFQNGVYDQYGCGEANSLAFECDHHNGLHVNSEHVIIECLNDEMIQTDIGNNIITNLDNRYMPIIRYKVGDVIELNDEDCSCGRSHPLIKKIHGRVTEYLRLSNGDLYRRGIFNRFFKDLKWFEKYAIIKWQIVHYADDDLVWNIQSRKTPADYEVKILNDHINQIFGEGSVKVNIVSEIEPERSGKHLHIKRQLRPNANSS